VVEPPKNSNYLILNATACSAEIAAVEKSAASWLVRRNDKNSLF